MRRVSAFICGSLVALLIGAANVASAAPLALTVADAKLVNEPAVGGLAVNIKLSPDSARTFEEFTAAHVGDTLDVMIDGKIVMSPKLIDPIRSGALQISGAFDRAEWTKIVARLKSGQSRLEVAAAAE
jgi:preprotein translocase subunit SecD